MVFYKGRLYELVVPNSREPIIWTLGLKFYEEDGGLIMLGDKSIGFGLEF
jgi:hypothetical protein